MAKRKSMKIQPSVQKLFFSSDVIDTDDLKTLYIDLSQCASLVNRRFYRQGLNWAVAGIRVLTTPSRPGDIPNGYIHVAKLPNTWVMSNAWEKGFRSWQKMNKQALDSSESIKPKFLDFKIYADNEHHQLGFGDNLIPIQLNVGGPTLQYTTGEWVHSTFHIPNASVDASSANSNNPRSVVAVGPSYAGTGADGQFAVSLIEGYAASRGLPDVLDPNTPVDAESINQSTAENWIAALDNDHDQQTGEVIGDMISENNIAPYPFENDGIHTDTMYPGGANQVPSLETVAFRGITGTTIGGETNIPGTNFPCGLMRLDIYNETDPFTCTIQVDLVPGNHRGYLCEPMTEM